MVIVLPVQNYYKLFYVKDNCHLILWELWKNAVILKNFFEIIHPYTLKQMKKILYFFALVLVAMLWSCEGKIINNVKADQPDTIVLKSGPDSLVAVIGAASTADRLQLLLKFQNDYPDTISVILPEALKPQKKKNDDDEKPAGFIAGKVVIAKISRQESGEYILHDITDVTETYEKACERYLATWTTDDSVAVQLSIAQGGKASIANAPKLHYTGWKFLGLDFKSILLTDTANVCDTATVVEGKMTLTARTGKASKKIVLEKAKKKND